MSYPDISTGWNIFVGYVKFIKIVSEDSIIIVILWLIENKDIPFIWSGFKMDNIRFPNITIPFNNWYISYI